MNLVSWPAVRHRAFAGRTVSPLPRDAIAGRAGDRTAARDHRPRRPTIRLPRPVDEYIATQLPRVLGERHDGKVVVAHLGDGASLCAVADGRSVATTMGFSVLDGLVMGTRCGTLDAGVLLYLMEHLRLDAERLSEMLYRRSGLLGVSGISGDMAILLASAEPRAAEAIDLFVYRIVTEIGALAAATGGLDALVFTAGSANTRPSCAPASAQGATGWAPCSMRTPTEPAGKRSTRRRAGCGWWSSRPTRKG